MIGSPDIEVNNNSQPDTTSSAGVESTEVNQTANKDKKPQNPAMFPGMERFSPEVQAKILQGMQTGKIGEFSLVSEKGLDGLDKYFLQVPNSEQKIPIIPDARKNPTTETSPKKPEESSFFRELTLEEKQAVESAKKSGFYGRYPIVRIEKYSGRDAFRLQDPDSGQQFTVVPGLKETVNMRSVDDPETLELSNFDAARGFVDRLLEANGEDERELFDPEVVRDMLSTIATKVPDTLPSLGGGPPEIKVKEKLRKMIRARVKYHNTNIKAAVGLTDFVGDFTSIREDEHREIFETKGVQTCLDQISRVNNGEFFRMSKTQADARKAEIAAYLQTGPGGGLTVEEAQRAVKLAERMSNIFGDSSYYDGVIDNGGVFKEFTVPGGNNVDYEAFANYFENNWNQIDIAGSLQGRGIGGMRRLFYFPVRLEQENRGTVPVLRKHLYMRATSAARFNGGRDVLDFMNNYKDLTDWATSISAANKNRAVFYEKDAASILNRPLLDPNAARRESEMEKAVVTALDNWKKNTDEGFGHLNYEQKKLAKMHLLKGILLYVNSRDGRDKFTYLGWNQNIRSEAIEWAVRDGDITRDQAIQLAREVGLSGLGIGWDASKGELGNTLVATLGAIFRGITRK